MNLDNNVTRVHEDAVKTPEYVPITAQTQEDSSAQDTRNCEDDAAFEPEESVWVGEVYLAYVPCKTEYLAYVPCKTEEI
jgi:hypothetical protein